MQPGGSITKYFRVLDASGAAVTGLAIGNFTVTAWHKPYGGSPATWTHGASLSEIASGFYALTYTAPATAGQWGLWIVPSTATYQIEFAQISDETENQDRDSLGNLVSRPIIGLTGDGSIGQTQAISLFAYRYRLLRFTFVDSAGDPVDMTDGTTYTAYRWSVRDPADQTEANAKFDQSTGITAGDGYVEVAVLENSSFFAAITEGASAANSKELRHELSADLVSPSGERVALVPSSVLTIYRREFGTG